MTIEPFARLPSVPADGYATHEVMNQATPLVGHNAFTGDRLLTEIAGRAGAGWASAQLAEAGTTVASARVAELAREANRHTPELRSHDRFGHRIDETAFPAWHELDVAGDRPGHACAVMDRRRARRTRRTRHALLSLERRRKRHLLSAGMTYSAVPALRLQPDLAAVWEPFILSTRYDPAAAPMQRKASARSA